MKLKLELSWILASGLKRVGGQENLNSYTEVWGGTQELRDKEGGGWRGLKTRAKGSEWWKDSRMQVEEVVVDGVFVVGFVIVAVERYEVKG